MNPEANYIEYRMKQCLFTLYMEFNVSYTKNLSFFRVEMVPNSNSTVVYNVGVIQ